MRLQDKTAIITGAARGIGESIAFEYAKNGAKLILMDINLERVNKTAEACRALGAEAEAFELDISDEAAVMALADEILSKYPKIDILVNNAGIYAKTPDQLIDPEKGKVFTNTKTEFMRRLMDINVMGTFYMVNAFLPHMQQNGSGKIINLGSVAGVNGIPGMTEYSASKGAIISFTKALAHEVASYGINVNCVSPGSILVEGRSSPKTYLSRLGEPYDIAAATVFLGSAESDFIVGQNLVVDGGRTLSLCCDH